VILSKGPGGTTKGKSRRSGRGRRQNKRRFCLLEIRTAADRRRCFVLIGQGLKRQLGESVTRKRMGRG
jgi:hypothetical protein